jgi:hypothetical protein
MDKGENRHNGLVTEKDELPRQPELAGEEDGAVPAQNGEGPAEDGLSRDPDFGLSEDERARIVRLEFPVWEGVRLTVLGQAARVEARLALDTVGQFAAREGFH